MKKKEAIKQEISHRKYKKPNPLIWGFLLNVVIRPFLARKYNSHVHKEADISKEKGPCFVVYNHQSRMDYVWLARCCAPRPVNFVIGYNEHYRSHLHFILKLLYTIPKKNFNIDFGAMRAMDSIIKQNGVVCFSPEGMSSISGHSQPAVTGTGKFLKHYDIPVYVVKTIGGFLTNTKVCLDERKGRVDSTISLLFSKEDLKNMSAEEIQLKLDEALWHDDYEWNKKAHVKYETNGRICVHLHDLLYRCPKCGHEFTMHGEGNKIVCSHCGNGATMDDYYDFHPFKKGDIIPVSPSRWFDEERRFVYQEIKANPNYSFEFDAKVGELDPYQFIKDMRTSNECGEGKVAINHEGFFFKGNKDGKSWEWKLHWEELPTLGMPVDMTYFSLYVNGDYYDLIPNQPIVGKVLLLVEEMARLHDGSWKNFPWMNWIYE